MRVFVTGFGECIGFLRNIGWCIHWVSNWRGQKEKSCHVRSLIYSCFVSSDLFIPRHVRNKLFFDSLLVEELELRYHIGCGIRYMVAELPEEQPSIALFGF